MNEYEVTGDLTEIDFGATGVKEVLQNVKTLLATTAHSCPLNREFPYNPDILDAPINIVQAQLTARIVDAVREHEPRAEVVSVRFGGDGTNGVLKPIVKVRVVNE